jgi:hypothetical protein
MAATHDRILDRNFKDIALLKGQIVAPILPSGSVDDVRIQLDAGHRMCDLSYQVTTVALSASNIEYASILCEWQSHTISVNVF